MKSQAFLTALEIIAKMVNKLRKIHSKCCHTWSGAFILDADQSNYQNKQNCGWNIYFKIPSSIFYESVSRADTQYLGI